MTTHCLHICLFWHLTRFFTNAYVDHTSFFVKDSQSLRRILKFTKIFERFSSLKINVEKCEAPWVGRMKENNEKVVNCKWKSVLKSMIRILGVSFSYNKQLAGKENFCNVMTDFHTLLNIWKQRWPSLAGEVQVFKSSVASKPVYIATMQLVPQHFNSARLSLHKEFIWDGKKPKRKRLCLKGSYEIGRLKDVDIAAKLTHIIQIFMEQETCRLR